MARINFDSSCLTLLEKFASARQDAKTKTTDQNNKGVFLDRMITQLAAYAEGVSAVGTSGQSGSCDPATKIAPTVDVVFATDGSGQLAEFMGRASSARK